MIHRAKPLSGLTNAELRTMLDESIRSEYAKETPLLCEAGILPVKDSRDYFREVGNSTKRKANFR